jgi:hypothetical protein
MKCLASHDYMHGEDGRYERSMVPPRVEGLASLGTMWSCVALQPAVCLVPLHLGQGQGAGSDMVEPWTGPGKQVA